MAHSRLAQNQGDSNLASPEGSAAGVRTSGISYRIARFACRRCGNCCKGDGIVRVTQKDLPRIARLLGLSQDEFLERHTTRTELDGLILADKIVGEERWCIFLERGPDGLYACAIQGAKPAQCVGFPFKWRPPDAIEWCAGLQADP